MTVPREQTAVSPSHAELVQSLCRYIEAHLEEPLSLTALGRRAGVSPGHLQRVFKRVAGISPRQYAETCRLGRLKSRLRKRKTVTDTLYEAGYGSSRALYEQADARLGMTPATYRRGGKGMHIRFSAAACPLGRVLLAATERGVSAVYLGDDDAELERILREEYFAAVIEPDDGTLSGWLGQLLEHLDGHRPHLDLPLDVQATAFQCRVWEELRKIPYGKTRSYGDIAAALGQPGAVRAVGRACASNPTSIVVPCHRVVRSDGDLGGYRWGLPRKRALLDSEQGASNGDDP